MSLIPLLNGALSLAAVTSAVPGTPEEFATATTACFAAQQGAQLDESKIVANAFEQEQAPPGWADRVTLYGRPGSMIAITVAKQTGQCAVTWVAQPADGANALTQAVVEAVSAAAEDDFAGMVRAAPPEIENAQSRYAYLVGNSFGFLIATEEGETVKFQFIALNRAQAPAASAN